MTMKTAFLAAAMLANTAAFAADTGHAPFADLIKKQLGDIRSGKVGDYRQVWGDRDASIDGIIAQAAGTPPTDLVSAIATARDQAQAATGNTAATPPTDLASTIAMARNQAQAATGNTAATPPTDLASTIATARDQARQSSTAEQSCVIALAVANNGSYASPRACTSEYVTKKDMETSVYPSLNAYLVGRLPNIDFAQDNQGHGFAVFYTPAGRVSEFILFTNSTR